MGRRKSWGRDYIKAKYSEYQGHAIPLTKLILIMALSVGLTACGSSSMHAIRQPLGSVAGIDSVGNQCPDVQSILNKHVDSKDLSPSFEWAKGLTAAQLHIVVPVEHLPRGAAAATPPDSVTPPTEGVSTATGETTMADDANAAGVAADNVGESIHFTFTFKSGTAPSILQKFKTETKSYPAAGGFMKALQAERDSMDLKVMAAESSEAVAWQAAVRYVDAERLILLLATGKNKVAILFTAFHGDYRAVSMTCDSVYDPAVVNGGADDDAADVDDVVARMAAALEAQEGASTAAGTPAAGTPASTSLVRGGSRHGLRPNHCMTWHRRLWRRRLLLRRRYRLRKRLLRCMPYISRNGHCIWRRTTGIQRRR
mgnify:CR=1 FL=1